MRPKKPETTRSGDLFRARLHQIVNLKHELAQLARQIDWDWIDGKIAVLDNAIDPATGMLVARAEFANADEALWPGQLCDLRIRLRMDNDLVTVPREAVQIGQKGNYVFVVEADVAKMRVVKTGREQSGRVVIQEGVKPGETVVVDGANLLKNDAAISVRPATPKPGAS